MKSLSMHQRNHNHKTFEAELGCPKSEKHPVDKRWNGCVISVDILRKGLGKHPQINLLRS